MKDMKQLINKWGESMLFSLLMALCLTWTFTACSDDKDNEYISDTQLSILEDNRTSLSYLFYLWNSAGNFSGSQQGDTE